MHLCGKAGGGAERGGVTAVLLCDSLICDLRRKKVSEKRGCGV